LRAKIAQAASRRPGGEEWQARLRRINPAAHASGVDGEGFQ
jgi:hypothetical protein